jgi:hypothetical protein
MGMRAYSANGIAFRECGEPETAALDEMFFAAIPTEDELIAVFPNYVSAKAEQQLQQQKTARKQAYTEEADALFFKAQRGECQLSDWQDKVAEIKQRYPY